MSRQTRPTQVEELCTRGTGLRLLVEVGKSATCKLPRNASSFSSFSGFPSGHEGLPCPSPIGQHDRGVLHKSPEGIVKCLFILTKKTPRMGTAQPAFAESVACPGQIEPGSRYAVQEQCPVRGVGAPPPDGSRNLEDLQEGSGRPLCLRRLLSSCTLSTPSLWG